MKGIDKVIEHWLAIEPFAQLPKNDVELQYQIKFLDELLDITCNNETHPLMGLVDLISVNIENYERTRFEHSLGTGIDALKFLMQEQGIKQSELPEIGSQGVVSEILNGKRELNRRQIERLAQRFQVSILTFTGDVSGRASSR